MLENKTIVIRKSKRVFIGSSSDQDPMGLKLGEPGTISPKIIKNFQERVDSSTGDQ